MTGMKREKLGRKVVESDEKTGAKWEKSSISIRFYQ